MDSKNEKLLMEMVIDNGKYSFTSSIETALEEAEMEIAHLQETMMSIENVKPNCDKLDYALAASSGLLCSILDIFLVTPPKQGNSALVNTTDTWFKERTVSFAKLCGWKGETGNTSAAIQFLEKMFKVPYDQRGAGDIGSSIFNLNPTNHHFKSLAHNPSLLGLFFSIVNQFTNTSHFVSNGEFISLMEADGKFILQGSNSISKLFCAFTNWIGHLISDVSGSSGSQGRGMGIPSPLWTWTNDIIALKRSLGIEVSEFNKAVNKLAMDIYKEGYDIRFQAAQAIPVLINELVVRFIYAIRRLLKYFVNTPKENRTWSLMWKQCEPFSNATVRRMLTVAHGVFCSIDVIDATTRSYIKGGGQFNPVEFFLRLNVVGVGRLTISLYGEAKRGIQTTRLQRDVDFAKKEKVIVENYIEGLQLLAQRYDDRHLIQFVEDFQRSDMYQQAFEKSVTLAHKRNVSENKILKSKADIDNYFLGGNKA